MVHAQCFREADCDTDDSLVIAEGRERKKESLADKDGPSL
jgi:hypothetical protein